MSKEQKPEEHDEFRIPSAVNIAIIVLVLAVIGVASVLLSKPTVSEVEKRSLAIMPKFSAESFFKGEFSKQTELFYSDTFPGREFFVSMKSLLEEYRGVLFDDVRIHESGTTAGSASSIPMVPETNSSIPITPPEGGSGETTPPPSSSKDSMVGEQQGNVFIYKGRAMSIFGGSNNMGKWYADVLNAYQAALGDEVQIYNIVVPTAIAFGLPEKYQKVSTPQKPNIDFIYSSLDPRIKSVDVYSALESHQEEYVYFRTDHHWTGLGAYYAYCAFAEKAGFAPPVLSDFEKRTRPAFLGSLYGQTQDSTLKDNPDIVDYYMPKVAHSAYRYVKNQPFTPYPTTVMGEYAAGTVSYSVFLHGDFPLMRIDTQNKNGRKVMLVKESFGNAFAPWLVNDYEQVFIVDERYFQLGTINFIKENGINELIFINNIFAANTAYHIQNISNMMYQQFVPPPPPEETPPEEVAPEDVLGEEQEPKRKKASREEIPPSLSEDENESESQEN